MSPIDVSVFPLIKRPELIEMAEDIKEELERDFIVEYDESGSIGRRYLRSSTAGTPFAVTIDFDSINNKDATLRDRDTEKQIRVPIQDLRKTIHDLLNDKIEFDKAGLPPKKKE